MIWGLRWVKGAARWALQSEIDAAVNEAQETERVKIADELRNVGLDSLAHAVHTQSINNWAAQQPKDGGLPYRSIRKGLSWK